MRTAHEQYSPLQEAELQRTIREWLLNNRSRLEADISRLVRIRSVSEKNPETAPYGQGCRDAMDEMLAIGREHGFQQLNDDYHVGSLWLERDRTARMLPGSQEHMNPGGTCSQQDSLPVLAIWGHLDVVPEGDGWTYPQYGATARDGYIIGRGAQDNKGPLVASLYVLECLREIGVELRHPVRLLFGCDEENGMRDIPHYLARHPAPTLSLVADCGFPVCHGEKGILELRLVSRAAVSGQIVALSGGSAVNTVPDQAKMDLSDGRTIVGEGLSRHAAFPEGSRNAIYDLMSRLCGSGVLCPEDERIMRFLHRATADVFGASLGIACRDAESGQTTCVGSLLRLHERHVELTMNIRHAVTIDASILLKGLVETASAAGFSVMVDRESRPCFQPKDHPAVRVLTEISNRIMGVEKEPYVMGGGTYARKLPNALGFGVGGFEEPEGKPFPPQHGVAHGPDEALHVENLMKAMEIYCMGLIALDECDEAFAG